MAREYKVGTETFRIVGELTMEAMNRVRLDAVHGIPASESSLEYTPDLLEYRRYFEAWRKTLPKGAIIDFPF